jgi:FkbM family methyltransferase
MIQPIKQKIYDFLYSMGLEVKFVRPINYTWLKELNIQTVLDIGANTGHFATFINGIIPQAQIYSFEPLKECYDQLLVNCAHLPMKAFHFALGDEEGKAQINVSNYSPSSSLLKLADLHLDVFSYTAFKNTEEITIKRLDQIAPQLQLKDRYLVKIDVQGFEDKVILGGEQTLKNAAIAIVETSFQTLYEGQKLFGEIHNMFSDLGFVFKGNMSQAKHPRDGSFLYADSIFYNRNRTTN